jgi:hypothetical protein
MKLVGLVLVLGACAGASSDGVEVVAANDLAFEFVTPTEVYYGADRRYLYAVPRAGGERRLVVDGFLLGPTSTGFLSNGYSGAFLLGDDVYVQGGNIYSTSGGPLGKLPGGQGPGTTIADVPHRIYDLDTDDIPPTAQTIELENILREDVVKPSLPVEAVLANAPARDGDFIVVPAILDER